MNDFDIEETFAALSARARAAGDSLDINEIAALAYCKDAAEENIKELLSLLGREGTELVSCERRLDKGRIKELCEKIRSSCEEEKTASGAGDAVKMYLRDIAAIEPLPPRTEHELMLSMLEGNEDAADELIEGTLHLCVSAAEKYIGRGMLFLDLVQEGSLAVMAAASEITDANVSFSGFCAFRLERLMMELAGSIEPKPVSLPRDIAEDMARLLEEEKKLEQGLSEDEKRSALAAALGLSSERVDELLRSENELLGRTVTALSAADDMEDNAPETEADKQLRGQVSSMLAALPEKEAQVIALRFGIGGGSPLSDSEIAERSGITVEEVKALAEQGMRRLGS